ncbi:MAG: tetratricopeptide repeat protein [Steroidobacteraceae bacterium]
MSRPLRFLAPAHAPEQVPVPAPRSWRVAPGRCAWSVGAMLFAAAAAGVAAAPAAAAASPADAPAGDVAAIAARAQAAYFAGNAAQLTALSEQTIAWSKSTQTAELYAHAYVQFRAEQLALRAQRNDEAQRAGEACVAALDAAVRRDPKFAEAFALQSACYGYLANLGGFGAIRNGSRSGKAIEAALALAPALPRVVLVDGFGLYFRPKFVGGDRGKGCERFARAAAAFDAEPAASAGAIGWGAAEAHYWSGRCAADAGDPARARREYERALALAPDFLAAKRRLAP